MIGGRSIIGPGMDFDQRQSRTKRSMVHEASINGAELHRLITGCVGFGLFLSPPPLSSRMPTTFERQVHRLPPKVLIMHLRWPNELNSHRTEADRTSNILWAAVANYVIYIVFKLQ